MEMALDIAFETIKSSHAKTQEKIKTSLNRSHLNDTEKHWVRYILQSSNLLYFVCMGEFENAKAHLRANSQSSKFDLTLKESLNQIQGKSSHSLNKALIWLRRRYRKVHAQHKKPVIRKARTYHVDSNMFNVFREKTRAIFRLHRSNLSIES
jgi:hypothetical protein